MKKNIFKKSLLLSLLKNGVILMIIISNIFLGCNSDELEDENAITLERVEGLVFSKYAGTYDADIEIEITCATEDVTIYYTTNGDTPNDSSLVYIDPITISGHGTEIMIKALAMKTGLRNGNLYSMTYEINYYKVSTLQFSEEEGNYSDDITVEITSETADIFIYYTTDGSEPDILSTLYVDPVVISGDESTVILKAVGVKDNMQDSDITTASYTINYEYVATPTVDVAAGTYSEDIEVEISVTTEDAEIYYTVDGTDPDETSRLYANPVTIAGDGASITLKAIAIKADMHNSEIFTGAYNISYKIAAPTYNYLEGSYSESIDVEIACKNTDVIIYYTTNGSEPDSSSDVYSDPITVSADTTIRSYAVKEGNQDSDKVSAAYTIDSGKVSTPAFNYPSDEYEGDISVVISCEPTDDPEIKIYYTDDGTEPSVFSTPYTGPIAVAGHGTEMTIKAIAEKDLMEDSQIGTVNYTINYKVKSPEYNKIAGVYDTDQDITISCPAPDADADIYYTIDGTTPDETSTLYAAPISIAGDGTTVTVKSVAYKSGKEKSEIIISEYTIDYGQAAAPEFNEISGTYNHNLSIEIATTTDGASIYYTDDGTDPTISSSLYSGAISVEGHGTTIEIKAIAVKGGLDDSDISTADYTIQYDKVATPEFIDPPAGVYDHDIDVELGCDTSGATISYKINAGASVNYTGLIAVAGHGTRSTIKAIAKSPGMLDSDVAEAEYSIYILTDHIIVVGEVNNGSNFDWKIMKFDESGVEDTENWNITVDGGDDDSARAVAIDSDNNVYVAGTMKTVRGYEWWIKKYNKNGVEDQTNWNKIIDDLQETGKDYVNAMVIDSNNNIYIAGSKDDQWLIKKFNSNGDEDTVDWNKTLGGTDGADEIYSIALDNNDNLYAIGSHHEFYVTDPEFPDIGVVSKDWWVKKFTTNGVEEWSNNIGSEDFEHSPYAIAIGGDDSIYGGGYYDEANGRTWHLDKYNINSGLETVLSWTYPDEILGNESIYGLIVDDAYNLYAAGNTSNGEWGESDWVIRKYDDAGVVQWSDISGGAEGVPRSIKIDSTGNVYVVGDKTNGNYDWWIRKFSSAGTEDMGNWNKVIGNSGSDRAYSIGIFN